MNFVDVGLGLDDVIENTGNVVFVIDGKGELHYANRLWWQTTGYSPQHTFSFLDILYPPDQAYFQALLVRLQSGDAFTSEELRIKSATGNELVFAGSLIPRFHEGVFVSITAMLRDITQHRHSMSELEHIFHQSIDMLGALDFEGHFVKINPACQKTLGYELDEMIGRHFLEFVHPEDQERSLAEAQQVIHGKVVTDFENRYRCSDGTYKWLSWNVSSYADEKRTYFVARDVTQRKLIEMHFMLRNQAVEFSPSAISIADVSLPDIPLIYINPAFERTTGYSALEVIGRNCRFLQNDDREQPALEEIRAALREGRSCTVVIRNYRKDGSLFYNELRLAPIFNGEGILTHFVGISTDVTDRVEFKEKIEAQNQALWQANQELAAMRQETEKAALQIQEQNAVLLETNRALAIARRQAEELAHLKSQFMATMSHELRTPLNAVIGYTEIQLAGMTGIMTDEQTDYQKRVLANAEHLLQLINDILDISRIEAGRLELVNKPFHLQRWLADIATQMSGLADKKSLRFESALDERMPDMLIGDQARIRQIAINLLSNAIKFTDNGFVKMQIRKHGRDAWKLIVSDSGIGIPSHMQEVIFEEFRQVDNTSQRKQGGTGLGLAIVRKLALMMGGNVRVTSQLEKGSTFTVILPMLNDTTTVHDEPLRG